MIGPIDAFLPYISIVISLCVLFGAYLAFRQGYSKEATRIQDRIIAAQKGENELLVSDVKRLQAEVVRVKSVVETIRYALKQRGIEIVVNKDFVMLSDVALAKTQTVPMQQEANVPPL